MNYHKILPFMAAFIAFNVAFAEQITTDGSRFASDKSAIKRACLQLPEDADFQTCLDCERLNRVLIVNYELGNLEREYDRLDQMKPTNPFSKAKRWYNRLDCDFQINQYKDIIEYNEINISKSFDRLAEKFVDPSEVKNEKILFQQAIANAKNNKDAS